MNNTKKKQEDVAVKESPGPLGPPGASPVASADREPSLPTPVVAVLFHLVYLLLPLMVLSGPLLLYFMGRSSMAVSYTVAYLTWFAWTYRSEVDGQGRPWPALENFFLWRLVFAWFPSRLLPPATPLSSQYQYIFGVHPHGGFAYNRAVFGFCTQHFWDQAFPGIPFRVLVATAAFRVPVIRELWLWSYCIDARKTVAIKALNRGYSLLLYPGGVKEQLLTERETHRVYLKDRKGFCKLALQHGCALVPIYMFGETDLYHHWSYCLPFRQWIGDRFGAAVMLLSGSFGLMPYRVPVTGVVGPPILVKKSIENPTQKQVNDLHALYVMALRDLFESQKQACGYGDAVLEIL